VLELVYTKNKRGDNKMLFDKFLNIFKTKAVRYLFNIQYDTPKWNLRNDEIFIREAYEKIVWAYACVTMISSSVSNVPWCLYKKKNGEIEEVENHYVLKLLNEKVNNNMSSRDFFDLWATYLALNGKFFAVFDSPINPTIIEPLIPYYTKVIPNLEEFISGVEYQISGQSTIYSKNLVLWSKFNDPLDLYNGLSPINAMARVLDTENSAIDWNKKSLDNAGIPPGALSVDSPTQEQIEVIKNKWLESYTGKNNVRVPLILDSEKAKYVNFGFNQIEMDFILQKKVNRIEICSGFGVPGQVVGDPEGQTYSNYNEAISAFWKNTVIPRYLNHIKSILNLTLKPKFLDLADCYIDYNLDGIEVLTENQNELTDRVLNMYNNDFITLNEGRQVLGWSSLEYGDNMKSKLLSDLLVGESENVLPTNELENETITNENEEEMSQENMEEEESTGVK
jgi:HK97 family phage portal protein